MKRMCSANVEAQVLLIEGFICDKNTPTGRASYKCGDEFAWLDINRIKRVRESD